MKPYRYYFSPKPIPEIFNKYVWNFYKKLSERVNVINDNKRSNAKSIDLFRHALRSDVMILNWPEETIHSRLGLIQTFISVVVLVIFRMSGGIIVWVCHNKKSHVKRLNSLQKVIRAFLSRVSQYIIVHSEDAVGHFEKFKQKVFFLSHPVYERLDLKTASKIETKIDVLIWGTIAPYKGLTEFIENYKKYNASFNVKIIGKADKEYYIKLTELAKGTNVSIEDRFLNDKELDQHFVDSKIILLPYLNTDTFSSGALIHSLNSLKPIIGPSVGNFMDLHKDGACLIFKDYNDLFYILNKCLEDQHYYDSKLKELQAGIRAYSASNSWESFISNLLNIINEQHGNSSFALKRDFDKQAKQYF